MVDEINFMNKCMLRSMFNVIVLLKTLGQTLMVQVAKRGASVLKRRKSRNRMEPPSSIAAANAAASTAAGNASTSTALVSLQQSSQNSEGQATGSGHPPPPRSESDGDVVFYVEEPRAGKLSIMLFLIMLELSMFYTWCLIYFCRFKEIIISSSELGQKFKKFPDCGYR